MFRQIFGVLVLFLAASSLTPAQNTASISGTVLDQQQAVVVGASVTLTNDKGLSKTAATSETGEYSFTELPEGTYTLVIASAGFKESKSEGIILEAAQKFRLDITLEPAEVVTQATVEGQIGAQLETEQSQIAGTITQKELVKIGLNGRNFTQLIALAPGVTNQTGQDEAKVGVQGSVKYSVNGGRVEYNTFDADGGDILNAGINGSQSSLIVYPSLDALADVQVLTSNYGAQYGKTASGTIIATTKSGGTEYHGDLYYFNRNQVFNARNFFDQTSRAPLYEKNDVGFTLGGPIYIPGKSDPKSSKTFFFVSEEWRIEKDPTGYTYNQAVPSVEERAGVFNDVCPNASVGTPPPFTRQQYPDCPAPVSYPVLNDVTHYEGYPGNAVFIDPVAQAIMNAGLIPPPNSNVGCNSTIKSCFDATISEPTNWWETLIRVDHDFNANNRFGIRFIHDSWDTQVATPQWAFLTNNLPTVQNDFNGPGDSVVARLTQTFSTTLLNQLTFGFTTDHITLKNIPGYGGASVTRTPDFDSMGYLFNNGFGDKIPGVSIGGNNAAYGGAGFYVDTGYMPWHHTNPTYTIREDMTKVWGKHTLQFGALFIIAQRNEINPPVGSVTGDLQGIAYFSNEGTGTFTGNAFTDFLLGQLTKYQQDSSQAKYYQRYRLSEPYIQDDWHVRSNLTLNLGLRLSLFGNWHEKYNNVYNWDPSKFNVALAETMHVNPRVGYLVDNVSNQPIVFDENNLDPRLTNGLVQCGKNGVPSSCIDNHIFNPEPRVGFAWVPFKNGKTSIRGGYGIFYEHGTGAEANTGSLEGSAPTVLDATQIAPAPFSAIGTTNTPSGLMTNLAFPLNVTSIPKNTPYPYVQQWSFGMQQELPNKFVFGAAYVGSKGTHLTAELQLNQLAPVPVSLNPFMPGQPVNLHTCGAYNSSEQDPQGYNIATGQFIINGVVIGQGDPAYPNLIAACTGHTQNSATPIPLPLTSTLPVFAPNVGNIYSLQNIANSSYNALQLTLRKVTGPLTLSFSYTYSHSLDDSSDRTDANFVNSLDLASNHASSDFDERHNLALSYIYRFSNLDKFFYRLFNWGDNDPSNTLVDRNSSSSSNGYSDRTKKFLDGWELSGIIVYQSGTPFTVINGGSPDGTSVPDSAGVVNNIGVGSYPDIVKNPQSLLATDHISNTFGPLLANPNLFAAPTGLTFGDAGRNFLNNPSRTNFDTALLKTVRLGESRSLEFRLETFNTFNHTQFRIYDPNRGNINNTISCFGGPDNLAGYVGNGVNCLAGNAFLHPVDAHRPRTLQLGVKFLF